MILEIPGKFNRKIQTTKLWKQVAIFEPGQSMLIKLEKRERLVSRKIIPLTANFIKERKGVVHLKWDCGQIFETTMGIIRKCNN